MIAVTHFYLWFSEQLVLGKVEVSHREVLDGEEGRTLTRTQRLIVLACRGPLVLTLYFAFMLRSNIEMKYASPRQKWSGKIKTMERMMEVGKLARFPHLADLIYSDGKRARGRWELRRSKISNERDYQSNHVVIKWSLRIASDGSLPAKWRRKGPETYDEGYLRREGRCLCPFEPRKKSNGKTLLITARR